jgi:hypothetical protein
MRKSTLTVILLAVCAVALVAWAQQDARQYSYARDVEPIFLKACLDCHDSDSPKKDLDLSKGKGYKAMLDVKSQEVAMPLLKAGDPAGSFLWLKLTHTATEGKGMPRTLFGAKKLHAEQLDLIKSWIIAGAQP